VEVYDGDTRAVEYVALGPPMGEAEGPPAPLEDKLD